MTNPFTAYAFPASGSNQVNRTLPARLADFKNVKDFGAVGDGITDDWAAITAAIDFVVGIAPSNLGTIYFPPGNYHVSQPIDFSTGSINAIFLGELGASTITGNFADYIFRRSNSGIYSQGTVIDKLNVVNNNASGGGIKLGAASMGAIRNCTVTANQGNQHF